MILLDNIAVQILCCESGVVDILDFSFHFHIYCRISSVLVFNGHGHFFFIGFLVILWISKFFDNPINEPIKIRLLVNKIFAKQTKTSKIVVASLAYYTRVVVVSPQLKVNRNYFQAQIFRNFLTSIFVSS